MGSFYGGVFIGYFSDLTGKKILIISPVVIASAVIMFIMKTMIGNLLIVYLIAIFTVGFCLVGSYNLLSSTAPVDLAAWPALKGNPNAII